MVLGARTFWKSSGKAKTPLFVVNAARAVDDDGVDVDLFLVLLVGVAGDVHDQELKGQRNLRGCQAEALGLVHAIHHAADLEAQIFIDGHHRFSGMAQRRVWVVDDFHGSLR